ncbi:MAG TPA: 2-amino-4-hydroxy-6-hydroxymethyldihydropteridine diphosphokinase, partial [Candidatus Eremiobacteraceae bacterium]|nr:2-amino-4-hydroxy-6-hydroxymethyldihydropteridine diphosphokinase [Candidatus Eremiobacteraceae bacterium]
MLSTDAHDSRRSHDLHTVAIAFGSNIGDRRGSIAAALQKLREVVRIARISSVYETTPVGYTAQPDFLNLTCVGTTALGPRALREALAKIERQVGRRLSVPLGPRAIDLDLLLYDDLILRDKDCTIPHPGLTTRAFVLIPLAEIAPDLVEPVSGKSVRELAAAVDPSGVRMCEGGLLTRIQRDVQESRPQVPLALNRAGITGVKTVITVPRGPQGTQPVIASFDIYADLDASHSGVHMSRFSQDLEDALNELTAGEVSDVG